VLTEAWAAAISITPLETFCKVSLLTPDLAKVAISIRVTRVFFGGAETVDDVVDADVEAEAESV
jgi:hypothetical protein